MKKKLFLGVVLLIICLAVAGCGKANNKENSNKDNKETVKKEKFESYKEFTEENYHEVIKNVFGIDPVEDSNWVFQEASDFYFSGEDGNASVSYSYKFDLNDDDNYEIEMKRRLFNAINAVSTDGVYGYLDISDDSEFVKSEKLTDFDGSNALSYKKGWIYTYDGDDIQVLMNVYYTGAYITLWRYVPE